MEQNIILDQQNNNIHIKRYECLFSSRKDVIISCFSTGNYHHSRKGNDKISSKQYKIPPNMSLNTLFEAVKEASKLE